MGCGLKHSSDDPVNPRQMRRWAFYNKFARPVGSGCCYCYRVHRQVFLPEGFTWNHLVQQINGGNGQAPNLKLRRRFFLCVNEKISGFQMGRERVPTSSHKGGAPSDSENSDVDGSDLSAKSESLAESGTAMGLKRVFVPLTDCPQASPAVLRGTVASEGGQVGLYVPADAVRDGAANSAKQSLSAGQVARRRRGLRLGPKRAHSSLGAVGCLSVSWDCSPKSLVCLHGEVLHLGVSHLQAL